MYQCSNSNKVISLSLIDRRSVLVHVTAWCQADDTLLPETISTHGVSMYQLFGGRVKLIATKLLWDVRIETRHPVNLIIPILILETEGNMLPLMLREKRHGLLLICRLQSMPT